MFVLTRAEPGVGKRLGSRRMGYVRTHLQSPLIKNNRRGPEATCHGSQGLRLSAGRHRPRHGERMRLWNRLRCWLVRSRLERDLAEEMRLHRETLEDQFVREGMPRSDARLAAARQFGSASAA